MVEVDYPPPSPRPPSPPLPPPPPHATEGELPPPAVPPHFMEKGEYMALCFSVMVLLLLESQCMPP